MTKKRNKIITKSISGLVVAVLAIMAFIRGPWMTGLLVAVFVIWAVITISASVVAYRQRQKYARRKPLTIQQRPVEESTFQFPDLDAPCDLVLLQHVNHRISAYLQTTYPGVTWEWVTESPVDVVRRSGQGHIKVFGAGEFNEAMVSFDDRAGITFHMMRVVSLAEVQGKETAGQERVPASLPVDVDAWYSVSGKSVLNDLVADLDSRGHSKLLIKDNGDVCVTQDREEVVQDTLYNMPDQVHWPLLVKVMMDNGLAATVDSAGIVVGW